MNVFRNSNMTSGIGVSQVIRNKVTNPILKALCLLHTLKMMMNEATTLQPTTKYSALHHVLLFVTPLLLFFFQHFYFLFLYIFVFILLHFLFFCYCLQFLDHSFYTHAYVNSKTSKTPTTFDYKRKQLSIITLFFHP